MALVKELLKHHFHDSLTDNFDKSLLEDVKSRDPDIVKDLIGRVCMVSPAKQINADDCDDDFNFQLDGSVLGLEPGQIECKIEKCELQYVLKAFEKYKSSSRLTQAERKESLERAIQSCSSLKINLKGADLDKKCFVD